MKNRAYNDCNCPNGSHKSRRQLDEAIAVFIWQIELGSNYNFLRQSKMSCQSDWSEINFVDLLSCATATVMKRVAIDARR